MVEKQHLFRRIIHSMAWIYLIYYLLPGKIFGYPRGFLLLTMISGVLGFEMVRIYKGWQIFGMREYEKDQIAAYAWATMAAGIALLLFPMYIAVISLVGMGVIDPMIGEIQLWRPSLYPYIPFITWSSIAVLLMVLITEYTMVVVITVAALGAAVALAAEKPTLIIDDDFLMVVVPAIVLKGIELAL